MENRSSTVATLPPCKIRSASADRATDEPPASKARIIVRLRTGAPPNRSDGLPVGACRTGPYLVSQGLFIGLKEPVRSPDVGTGFPKCVRRTRKAARSILPLGCGPGAESLPRDW